MHNIFNVSAGINDVERLKAFEQLLLK